MGRRHDRVPQPGRDGRHARRDRRRGRQPAVRHGERTRAGGRRGRGPARSWRGWPALWVVAGCGAVVAGYDALAPLHRFAFWLLAATSAAHLGLALGHGGPGLRLLFLLDAVLLAEAARRLALGRRWRLLAGLLLSGSIVAYWAAVLGGEAPDQIGLAMKLVEITALAVVLRPADARRRFRGWAASGADDRARRRHRADRVDRGLRRGRWRRGPRPRSRRRHRARARDPAPRGARRRSDSGGGAAGRRPARRHGGGARPLRRPGGGRGRRL